MKKALKNSESLPPLGAAVHCQKDSSVRILMKDDQKSTLQSYFSASALKRNF